LGKTIIFAKNNDHAEFIAARFNANYPHYMGEFARVITFKTEYTEPRNEGEPLPATSRIARRFLGRCRKWFAPWCVVQSFEHVEKDDHQACSERGS